ncbi:hypothetical protein [Brevibacillus dissolubilis]|uniref:hypothetical protein n=1 Tax=Brevibacillus dissolubilis TaxID=1844116 RepID=UPI001116198F|nr:hypothetical protein [Brevibacillus dissolubilis]
MTHLQRFDLLFVKGESVIGRTIRRVTGSPYSHVAIVLDPWHVAETDWRYPLKVRHLNYPRGTYDVFRYQGELFHTQMMAMDDFLHMHISTPYDLVQTVTNGLNLLCGTPVINDHGRMNCTEFAARMFGAAGVLMPAVITPGEFSQHPQFRKIA